MKLRYIIVALTAVFSCSVYAQQGQDENAQLIYSYFNANNTNSSIGLKSNTLEIFQRGVNNYIDINISGKANEKINQNGKNNSFEILSFYNKQDSNLQLFQNGNNNSVQIFGQNSLAKDMIIRQTSNFKNIIITNY